MNTTTYIALNAVLSLVAFATVATALLAAHRLRAERPRETDSRRWADPLPLSVVAEGGAEREEYAEAA